LLARALVGHASWLAADFQSAFRVRDNLEASTNIETEPEASEAVKKSTVLSWVGQVFDLRLTSRSAC